MAPAAPASVSSQTIETPADFKPLFQALHAIMPDAYLVGGAVRDLLSGRRPHDLDFVTRRDPEATTRAIAEALDGHAFPLDDARGQYRVVLAGQPVNDIDVSRIDELHADLARRDFTINAMAVELQADGGLGPLLDDAGGQEDLDAGIIRMTSPQTLCDDPLRLLRAVRIASELEFTIDPETATTIRQLAHRLPDTAGERQREELVRTFATPRAAQGIRLADDLALLDVLLPELAPARGVEQPSNHHYYDVFEHSIHALASLDQMLHETPSTTDRPWLGPDFRDVMAGFEWDAYLNDRTGGTSRLVLLKLATLLHDVSKPETKSRQPDGRIRFLGHPEQGAVKAAAICERLRFGNRETRFVSLLVEEHLRPTMLAPPVEPPSRRALYRFLRDLGEAMPACLILSLADAAAATGPRLQRERWRGHVAYCRYVLYEASRIDSPVQAKRQRLLTGNDLMSELGMEPGPQLGHVLSQVEEAQAVGEIETRAEAIELARRLTPPPTPSPPAERGLSDVTPSERTEPRNQGLLVDVPSREGGGRWQTSPELWDKLRDVAREFRHEQTEAERRLWNRLRRNQIDGLQFRRQHVIDRFIVDFYCPVARLVVEVDGPVHQYTAEEDAVRQQFLESLGLTVLRFTNEEVMNHLDAVVDRIRATAMMLAEQIAGSRQNKGGEASP